MENVGLMIKANLSILLAIRECYIAKFNRIHLNCNRKNHTLICTVHTAVIPDLIKEIYTLMHLLNTDKKHRYSVSNTFLKLNEANYMHGFNYIFSNSTNKEAILQICSDIDFFTKQSFNALEQLETLI